MVESPRTDEIAKVVDALRLGFFDDPKSGDQVVTARQGLNVIQVVSRVAGIGEWISLDNTREFICLVDGVAYRKEMPPKLIEYYRYDFHLRNLPTEIIVLWREFLAENPDFPRVFTADWTIPIALLEETFSMNHKELADLIAFDVGINASGENEQPNT